MIQTVNVNVAAQPTSGGPESFLVLSQNENGRQIRFRVLGDDLPAGCTATFSGTKPDGTVYSASGTIDGNFVLLDEEIQMTAVSGRWDAKLSIAKGTENIMTSLIRVTVVADAVSGDSIPSDSELDGIVAECRSYAEAAKNEAYGSPLTAATAAAMTDQSRVYVYTGSETGYTSGHWYYYNGTAWADGGVYNAVAVDTDTTLSIAGKAADAKEVGDQLTSVKEDLSDIENEFSHIYTDYENGGVNMDSGVDVNSTKSVRLPLTKCDDIANVYIANGHQSYVFSYASDGTYLGRTSLGKVGVDVDGAYLKTLKSNTESVKITVYNLVMSNDFSVEEYIATGSYIRIDDHVVERLENVETASTKNENDISVLNTAFLISYSAWEQGGIRIEDGIAVTKSKSVRTGRISCDSLVKAHCPAGHQSYLFSYSANGAYLGRTNLYANGYDYTGSDLKAMKANTSAVQIVFYNTSTSADFSVADIPESGIYINVSKAVSFADFGSNIGQYYSANPPKIITWVDDDTVNVTAIGKVKSVCDTIGCKATFACVTKYLTTQATLDTLKQYQKEGFQIVSHSKSHDEWYTGQDLFTQNECETDLVESLLTLNENQFLDNDFFVYPGGLTSRDDVNIEGLARKYCKMGIRSGALSNATEAKFTEYGLGAFMYNRIFIDKNTDPTASNYTNFLDSLDNSKARWVIFGTHSNNDTQFDATLITNILQYAISNGWQIMTLGEAYKYRKKYFDLKETFALL